MMKIKKNTKNVKPYCLRDIARLYPNEKTLKAFRLKDDGRQWQHNAQQRYAVLLQLATYASADGTNSRPAVTTLVSTLGRGRSTVYRYLADLGEGLKFIVDAGIHETSGVRQWTIDLEATKKAVEKAGRKAKPAKKPVPSTPQDGTPKPVPSSQGAVPSSHIPVPSSQGAVPSSTPPVPSTPQDGTLSPLGPSGDHQNDQEIDRQGEPDNSSLSGQVGFEESVENLEAGNLEGQATTSLTDQPPTSIGAATELPKNSPPPPEGCKWVAGEKGWVAVEVSCA